MKKKKKSKKKIREKEEEKKKEKRRKEEEKKKKRRRKEEEENKKLIIPPQFCQKQMHIKCKAHARLYKYSSGFHTYKNVPLHPYYFLHSSAKNRYTLNARHTHGCTNTVLVFTRTKMFLYILTISSTVLPKADAH